MELMAFWKVKLETPMNWSFHVDKTTGKHVMAQHHTQYEFTLADALQYICGATSGRYMFEKMMVYNICLRDALRSFGAQKVIDSLRRFAPANERLEAYFTDFARDCPDEYFGSLDIQVYSIMEDVTIMGETFHGLDDIKARLEITQLRGSSSAPSSLQPQRNGQLHVGEVWDSYPCFDSYDFASENRTYQNYIIRDRRITHDDIQQVMKLHSSGNYQLVSEQMPPDMLPMVYYVGEGGFMLVATRK